MAQNHLIMQRVLFSFKRQRIKDTLQQNAQKEKKKLNTHTSRFFVSATLNFRFSLFFKTTQSGANIQQHSGKKTTKYKHNQCFARHTNINDFAGMMGPHI